MATTPPSPTLRDSFVDVADHPIVWRWMRETARRDPDGFMRLIGANSTRLRRMYGPPTWKADGKDGWDQGWSTHENGLGWMVLTGEAGTIFRVQIAITVDEFCADRRMGTGITQHLGYLIKTLMGGY